MTDIARLGLSIDSSEVKKGASALDTLTNSSAKAEKASGGLKTAFDRLERLLSGIERAVRDVESAVDRMAAGLSGASGRMNGLGAASSSAASKVEALSTATAGATAAHAAAEQAAGRASVANDNAAASAARLIHAYGGLETTLQRVNKLTGLSGGAATSDRGADIAAFGAQLDALRAKFNPVFAVISQYRSTLSEIRSAHAVGAISADEMAAAIGRERQAALGAISAIKSFNAIANDNSRAMGVGSHHAANLAAQFQDVAVSAAMGMNPMQVALQQGTQMAMVFSAMANEGGRGASTLSLLAGAFATVLSPAALVIISVTALVAGLLQLVNWTKLAQGALHGVATVLPTIAPYAAAAAAAVALLYAPQIIAGITSVVALIARLTVSLVMLAASAAAANPFAAFVLGTAVAITALSVFQKEIAQAFGVDIVGYAKTGVNYVIGAFVAAFGDIKFLWNQFPNIMGSAAIDAANAVISAMERMINSGIALLNTFIGTANQALSKLPGGVQIGQLGKASIGQIANPYAASLNTAGNARAIQQQAELNRDYLGTIGGALSKGASSAASQLKEWAAQLGVVEEKSKKAKTEADKFADIIAGADRRIASLQAEAAAFGLTEEAAARLRYEQDLLNQASQRDISLSAAQRAELAAKAAEMAHVETAAKKVREAYDFVRDGVKGFIEDLRSGLQQGQSFWQAFGNAATNVLDKIIKKIEDELVDALLGLGSNGTLGGILSGLVGGGGTVGATTGASFGFASGGYTGNYAASRVAGIVHGGEYVFSKRATDRIGVGTLEAMHNRAKGYASGGYVPGWSPHPQRSRAAPQAGAPNGVNLAVNIQNAPSTPQVKAEDDGNGGVRLDVLFDEQVASSLRRTGSATQRAMRSYGAQPALVRR